MQFTFTAVNQSGIRSKGVLDANSEKEVTSYLRENNLTPITIQKQTKGLSFLQPFKKVNEGDVVLFTRELASMTATGLTLIEALNILKDQTTKPLMRETILDLIASVSGGSTFSQALEAHRGIFSDVYIALIRAAETGGLLDKVLERLADNLEKSQELKKKIRSALFYPAIIVVGIIVVIISMNVFVIPQLSTLYEGLNVKLPLTTVIVLSMSQGFTTFFPIFIVLAIVGFFLFKRFKKTENGQRIVDTYVLKIPIIGQIIRLSIEDEIVRTLSLLISSGTSILESLSITANVAGNYKFKQAIESTGKLVERGIPLSSAFDQQRIFPQIMVQMTKVGESTGKIDESLERVAGYYERDLDGKVRNLTTAIEPLLLLVLGVSVGFLIISVISPIYSLISSIQ